MLHKHRYIINHLPSTSLHNFASPAVKNKKSVLLNLTILTVNNTFTLQLILRALDVRIILQRDVRNHFVQLLIIGRALYAQKTLACQYSVICNGADFSASRELGSWNSVWIARPDKAGPAQLVLTRL